MTAPAQPAKAESAEHWKFSCGALLLDLDGTLVDSTEAILRGWHEWARTAGAATDRLVDIVHGRAAADTINALLPGLSDDQLRRHIHDVLRIQETDPAPARPIAGATELVAGLDAGQWAVVTGCSVGMATVRLAAGRLPTPDVLVGDEHVRAGKPDPEGYLLALRRLGIGPGDAVAVEDAPAGVAAARAAGIRTIAVTSTHPAAALADADVVVTSLEHIRVLTAGGRITLTSRIRRA
jgi:sugar-phosphatase